MSELLLLRVQEMHVAGGADRFVQLLGQLHDGAVQVPQALFVSDGALIQQEEVVADGLNFQEVVPGRNAPQLPPVLVVQNGLEQLAGSTGTAHDEPLSVLVDEALGHDGEPVEVLQVGQGNEFIEVAQAGLVLGQQDDVPRLLTALHRRAQLEHLAVDLVDALHPQVPQHPPEGHEHITHHGGVVAGAVVVEGGQFQVLRHDVQFVFPQIRQQVLRQNEGVDGGIGERSPHPGAAFRQKAHVELGVVGGQRAIPHPVQKGVQCLLLAGGVGHHGVGDAGQLHDVPGDGSRRVDKGVVLIHHFPVLEHHGADLGDDVPFSAQTSGLDVEADDLGVYGQRTVPVHHHSVVHVVDEVAFHAVDDLDFVPGSTGRVRECLGDAVVGDGDGLVPPGDGALDRVLHLGEGVHLGKSGM